jgi:DNA-binding XRE family transcriptional regulator
MEQKQIIKIRQQLKQYRLDHDLTFDDVAAKLNVAGSTIFRIEKGLVAPNERNLYKLQKMLSSAA